MGNTRDENKIEKNEEGKLSKSTLCWIPSPSKRCCHLPAIVFRPFPMLSCCHRLYRLVDPRAGGINIKAQTSEHGAKQTTILHAIAAAPAATLDDLME